MTLLRLFSTPMSELFGKKAGSRRPEGRARPLVGTTICHGEFRISVPVGFNDDLWPRLAARGWRPMGKKQSRYRYRALPSSVVAALADAPKEQRERLLSLALRRAAGESQPVAA